MNYQGFTSYQENGDRHRIDLIGNQLDLGHVRHERAQNFLSTVIQRDA
jgi:hypothetical protein